MQELDRFEGTYSITRGVHAAALADSSRTIAILELGSMNKAAQKLKQPFRAVWGKIRATEQRCGFKIVERTSEGSRLTREGLELLDTYGKLTRRCDDYTDQQFNELFKRLPVRPEITGKEKA